jgi:hypothetical protein
MLRGDGKYCGDEAHDHNKEEKKDHKITATFFSFITLTNSLGMVTHNLPFCCL